MKWTNWVCLIALGLTTLLTGCGGGGSGGGGGAVSYTITLRADRTDLPLNIVKNMIYDGIASIGGQYTTTLYVDAKDTLGNPIPGGDDVIGCSIISGLDSGALYYLDGDPDHQTTVTIDGVDYIVPLAFRSVSLGSNAGGSSFHFHTTDIVGTATIRCSVTEPDTGIQRSAQVTIRVGGDPSGKVSQIVVNQVNTLPSDDSYPGYIWIQGAFEDNQAQIQAQMVDEAGQPVPNPAAGVNNLQVRIVPSPGSLADDDATLRGVNASGVTVQGASIHIRSINGQAQFTLVSGTNPGGILLEAIGDRSDNNVGNGIAEPILNYYPVLVVSAIPPVATPVTIDTDSLPSAAGNVPYGALLEASGGTAPYTWTLIAGELPTGLVLNPSGTISGTPTDTVAGTYNFVLRVTDGLGTTAEKSFFITYAAAVAPSPPSVTTSSLSAATAGTAYATALTASGGTPPYSWSAVGLPAGLSINAGGVISGTAPAAGTYPFAVTVTDNNGLSGSRGLSLTVNAPGP